MSIELNFNPNSFPIPGIVTVPPHEVDVPSGDPNSINNPDLSQVQGLDPSVWKVVNGTVVPFSNADLTKKFLFDGPASQAANPVPSDSINMILHQLAVGDSPQVFAQGIKVLVHVRWMVSNKIEADAGIAKVLKGQTVDLLNSTTAQIQLKISNNGDVIISKLRGIGSYDVYLDANYL